MTSPDEARPLHAALWMLGAVASFTSMALAGRRLGGELDTFEIMSYRSAVGLFIVVSVALATGRMAQIDMRRLPLHLVRNLSHFAGQNLWFFAVTAIPFAQVFAFEFTAPLWVVLLAPLVLGERLTRMRALAAVAGFVGILLVARPGAVPISAGMLAALAAAVGFAGSLLFTKLLTRSTTVICILFWLTFMQLFMGLALAGWDGEIALPQGIAIPLVILVAIAGLTAHLCLTTALSLAPATLIVPIDFLRLPVIAVIGALFYAEPFDPFVLVGAGIIFGANYANLMHERRR